MTPLKDLQTEILALANGDIAAVVGVCGLSGAGKTTFCRRIADALPDRVSHVECDYLSIHSYTERTKRIKDARSSGSKLLVDAEENPLYWIDWEATEAAVKLLSQGRDFVWEQGWNKNTGERDKPYSVKAPKGCGGIVLVDSICLLHEPIRSRFHRIVYLKPDASRLEHNLQKRRGGCEPTEWAKYITSLEQRYVIPYFDSAFLDEHVAVACD